MRETPKFRTQIGEGFELAKIPPQAVELEEIVLGACLLEGGEADRIHFLKPNHFYKEAHQIIFTAIRGLLSKHKVVDLMTVANELKRVEKLEVVGGPYYLSQLTNRVSSAQHIEEHSRILIEKSMARDIIRISSEAIQEGYLESVDVFELLEKTNRALENLGANSIEKGVRSIGEIFPETVDLDVELRDIKQENKILGTPSGIQSLDDKTGGFMKGDLIIIAGRPGMGKTALALSMARYSVKHDCPTLIFSLEMKEASLVQRFKAMELDIPVSKFVKTGINSDELEAVFALGKSIQGVPMYFIDSVFNIEGIKSISRTVVKKMGIKQIIVDYLQLLETQEKTNNREQSISTISRGLKKLAMQLDIPIIALCQLNRDVDKRAIQRPKLSDLRESGALEQDADTVIFTFRPEYYGHPTIDLPGMPSTSTKGLAELIIAKQRNGACGSAVSTFDAKTTRFRDWVNPEEKIESEPEELPF